MTYDNTRIPSFFCAKCGARDWLTIKPKESLEQYYIRLAATDSIPCRFCGAVMHRCKREGRA